MDSLALLILSLSKDTGMMVRQAHHERNPLAHHERNPLAHHERNPLAHDERLLPIRDERLAQPVLSALPNPSFRTRSGIHGVGAVDSGPVSEYGVTFFRRKDGSCPRRKAPVLRSRAPGLAGNFPAHSAWVSAMYRPPGATRMVLRDSLSQFSLFGIWFRNSRRPPHLRQIPWHLSS